MSTLQSVKITATIFISFFSTCVFSSEIACPAFPYFKPTSGPLAQVNCDFHTEYEKRIKKISATFGAPEGRPVALNLGGNLVLKYNGTTKNISINPPEYDDVKVFGHAVLTVLMILSQQSSGELNQASVSALQNLQNNMSESEKYISKKKMSPSAREACQTLSSLTKNIIQKILSNKTWTHTELHSYFKATQPALKVTFEIAAREELEVLNRAIIDWMLPMTNAERKKISFVVATSHQARSEEISIQYFMKKFNKKVGVGAMKESDFVVLEGKFDEASALALLARHYLDREIGSEIFNDPESLQRDLLSSVARQVLEEFYFLE